MSTNGRQYALDKHAWLKDIVAARENEVAIAREMALNKRPVQPESLDRDIEYLSRMSGLSRAEVLMQHLSALQHLCDKAKSELATHDAEMKLVELAVRRRLGREPRI